MALFDIKIYLMWLEDRYKSFWKRIMNFSLPSLLHAPLRSRVAVHPPPLGRKYDGVVSAVLYHGVLKPYLWVWKQR